MVMEKEKKQGIPFISDIAKRELSALIGLEPSTVLGIEKKGGERRATLEMIEKRSIPDAMDLLST